MGKCIFDPFLTHFSSQNRSFSLLFWTLEGPKWLKMDSKWALFTCLCSPNAQGSFWKKIFDPFVVPEWPIFKAFWHFQRAKASHHGLKTG